MITINITAIRNAVFDALYIFLSNIIIQFDMELINEAIRLHSTPAVIVLGINFYSVSLKVTTVAVSNSSMLTPTSASFATLL